MATRIGCLAVALLLAVCAFWYHRHVVDGYKAELSDLKNTYAQAQAKIIENMAKTALDVLSEREEKYADIYDHGKAAAVSIAKAESKNGDVDLGGLIPGAVSDALLMQHERICASGACGIASGSPVQAETSSSIAGSTR